MTINEIASAVLNDIQAGTAGLGENDPISIEQLEDEVLEKRETVIREWIKRGLIEANDLAASINCIKVDCADPIKCCTIGSSRTEMHFEIPPLLNALGEDAIIWIGSADRKQTYDVYLTPAGMNFHKYKRRGKDEPYVYIERTENANGMYDGWIFNLPFVKTIAMIGVFKDPRDLEKIGCNGSCDGDTNVSVVADEVKNRLTKEKFYYYRQALVPPTPNDQVHR